MYFFFYTCSFVTVSALIVTGHKRSDIGFGIDSNGEKTGVSIADGRFVCRCEEPRFVRGWYRPASRATSGSASPYQQATARAAAATVHSTTGEESIYESADHPPSCRNACNTPDSERYAPHAPTRHWR